jgi:CheY-like chemotaxis protein
VERPRILVVDDSPDMRDVLQQVLVPAGYEVIGVPSGARALAHMSKELPDLVITDLLMPGMSGFTLRASMLRRPELARIPVIILSGYWQRPSETLEAAAVLPKPLNIDLLLNAVARFTRERAPAAGA